jgi:hypothetical protein
MTDDLYLKTNLCGHSQEAIFLQILFQISKVEQSSYFPSLVKQLKHIGVNNLLYKERSFKWFSKFADQMRVGI